MAQFEVRLLECTVSVRHFSVTVISKLKPKNGQYNFNSLPPVMHDYVTEAPSAHSWPSRRQGQVLLYSFSPVFCARVYTSGVVACDKHGNSDPRDCRAHRGVTVADLLSQRALCVLIQERKALYERVPFTTLSRREVWTSDFSRLV